MGANSRDDRRELLCAIYTRKSTDENLNSGFTSLDSQREYCQAFIKSREAEGWRVQSDVYCDPGFSGGNMDRPALKRLLADARAGKFQIVVCYKYDRLSRNTRDFLHVLDIFEKSGVAFVSVTQPIDTTSSVGRLMRSILVDFSQFERELISERTRDKMAAMAGKGKRTGGSPILGYDIDKDKKALVVNSQEAEVVREMFDSYLTTRSLWATAKALHAKGYRLKEWTTREGRRRGGGRFDRMNLWYLLRNPLYVGKIRFRGEALPGEHAAIITDEVFAAVGKTLNGNGKGRRNRAVEEIKHVFHLRGLVRCAACGSAMTPHGMVKKTGQRFFYYRCVSVNKRDRTACSVRSVPAKALESFVIERLGVLSANHDLVAKIVQDTRESVGNDLPGKRQQKTTLAAEMGKIDAEARNLVSILGEQGPTAPRRAFYEARLDELAARKAELEQMLPSLEQEIIKLECQQVDADIVQNSLKNFLSVLSNLEGQKEQRELLTLLLKEVVFDGNKSRVRIDLKPLPQVWGDLDQLEGRFVYCKSWLPE